jgi:methylglyoxal synthase
MISTKKIALVAHDNRKSDLVEWVEWNLDTLIEHEIICTGTTGTLVENAINTRLDKTGPEKRFSVKKLKSGPLGGDQQLGAMISEGNIDFMIFFWDPMEPHPHDVDVKALLRIAVVYNVPIACNRATADYMISSSLMNTSYHRILKDYTDHLTRPVI